MNEESQIVKTGAGPAPAETGGKSGAGKPARRGKRSRRRRLALWTLFVLFDVVVLVGLALFVASVSLAGRELDAPEWVAEKAGAFFSRGLGGGQAEIGRVSVRIPPRALPQVIFQDVNIANPAGAKLVTAPSLRASVDRRALFEGKAQVRGLRVEGASMTLRRGMDGSFDLGFGAGPAPAMFGSLEEAIAAVRSAFELPALAPIERIEVEALTVIYEDARAGRAWHITDGALLLTHEEGGALSLSVSLRLPDETDAEESPASVSLRLSLGAAGVEAEAQALIENVAAADIAAHSPALSWLEPLDARVSGALIARTTPEGRMGPFNGKLEIGPGVFQPETGARPIPFDGARTYFGYRPETARITFEELNVQAPNGTLTASGHADFEGLELGWPTAMIAQLNVSRLRLDPVGFLPQAADFENGAVDVKVSLDPFEARIGQLVITTAQAEGDTKAEAPTRIEADGVVSADADGWKVSLDLAGDRIDARQLMALWPFPLAPRTRDWLDRRLLAGMLQDVRAGVRLVQDQRPDTALTFQFQDAELQPMDGMPPVTGGAGYATIGRGKFALSLEKGQIVPPDGGMIDISGATFSVPDTRAKPAQGQIEWRSSSTVTAALSLLDQPPFRFLSKAGKSVELADGQVRLEGRIAFPMKRGIIGADVDFGIGGLSGAVRSDVLVPGRTLDCQPLELWADPREVRITGGGKLDGVPIDAVFRLPLGKDAGVATVAGNVQLGETFVKTFGIGLPEGAVRGTGSGTFEVTLPHGGPPPSFTLSTDLKGIALSLPPLGWRKGEDADGTLEVSGQFSSPPVVDGISLKAAGLTTDGKVTLKSDGTLDEARFSRVAIGGWLDAPVTLRGRGAGRDPAISVRGGRVDVRKTSLGGGSRSSGAAGPPIALALDRLVVSNGISLTGFRGELTSAGGLSGKFTAAVNGQPQAQVSGTLVPGRSGGTAVRILSQNAGATFKAAGFFQQGSGGDMSLVLQPRGTSGEYDGQLKVENVRVRSASPLTALVNAISVVGLIDELNGGGILFTDVEAEFTLTPRYMHVRRSSGTGPSLGISMEGVYDILSDQLNMQGVFSPVYMVNSIGSIFTRKGEGLVGFNYTMRGPSDSPSVQVNPLSALTPGMFREIFRAPPPKPAPLQGGG